MNQTTTKIITFFNNKGGVGKTSLLYHLAFMYSDLGKKVLAVDLDPQSNLSSYMLDESDLENIMTVKRETTILGSASPLLEGSGDIKDPHPIKIDHNIFLLVGDLSLSKIEDDLSDMWPRCLEGNKRAFRVESIFFRIAQIASKNCNADIVLFDIGPNLGALNRSALISSDYVVIPVTADLFSLQGLTNLGPTLYQWRDQWEKRLEEAPSDINDDLPKGKMEPCGYIIMQHGMRENRPVKSYERWAKKIPAEYRSSVLRQPIREFESISEDPYCLSMIKHYRSLMPMAMSARKPMFHLTPADGAIGAHVEAVRRCYGDFENLAHRIAQHCNIII